MDHIEFNVALNDRCSEWMENNIVRGWIISVPRTHQHSGSLERRRFLPGTVFCGLFYTGFLSGENDYRKNRQRTFWVTGTADKASSASFGGRLSGRCPALMPEDWTSGSRAELTCWMFWGSCEHVRITRLNTFIWPNIYHVLKKTIIQQSERPISMTVFCNDRSRRRNVLFQKHRRIICCTIGDCNL